MNIEAMKIPKRNLVCELDDRIRRKTEEQAALDGRFGAGRIQITSYMENIGWPELFGYDMNRYLEDPAFCMEQELRQRIFWLDNVDDDTIPDFKIWVNVGMYWDSTLFGQKLYHTPGGVPEFLPHPFSGGLDLGLLERFEFSSTGDMPRLLEKHRAMEKISVEEYDGKLKVEFPMFHRGPLDIFIQLRGYENFIDDINERPRILKEALEFISNERYRFACERCRYLGEKSLPSDTFVADDWVNIPFISPDFFRDFVVPVYSLIRKNEGEVTGFHTCGNMEAVLPDLIGVFPRLKSLDISGWNDIEAIDRLADRNLAFSAAMINTVTLTGTREEQESKLDAVRRVGQHRGATLCAQAIVRLLPTYEETLERLGGFVRLSKEKLLSH